MYKNKLMIRGGSNVFVDFYHFILGIFSYIIGIFSQSFSHYETSSNHNRKSHTDSLTDLGLRIGGKLMKSKKSSKSNKSNKYKR